MRRPLPTDSEVREILSRRRTRPAPRPAPRAGRSLAKFIREMDEKFGRGADALEPRWTEIVGERLARVTRPQKLTRPRKTATGAKSGGVLELRVAGPAALLVQHQSEEIIQRINLFLGPGSVEKLRIAQGPVTPRAAASKPARTAPKRPVLPAAQQAALDQSVSAAPDRLKAALSLLGRGVLSQSPDNGDPSNDAR